MNIIFSKKELSDIFDACIIHDICSISLNSKEICNGSLFVAHKGEKVDGHIFLSDVFAKGAVLAIVDEQTKSVNLENFDKNKIIKVKNTLDVLVKLAAYKITQIKADLIAVTGSVGKTTTKNILYHILSSQNCFAKYVYASKKNFNSKIGLPLCVASMPSNAEIGIFEIGISAQGDLLAALNIIQPNFSIISNICESHCVNFDSVFDIARAKSEIFATNMPQDAVFISAESAYCEFLKSKAKSCGVKNVYSFGDEKSDAKIISADRCSDGFVIVAEILGKKIKYKLSVHNESCIINSLSSILSSHIITGISLEQLANSVETFAVSNSRGEKIYLKKSDIILIDDSYNACPTSMKSAIKSLGAVDNRRKILVFGDMLELGQDSVIYHENLSATISRYGINLVFVCGHFGKIFFDNLQEKFKGGFADNSEELAKIVLQNIQNGDCVLVKGSNSMNMKTIVNAMKDKK